MFSEEKHKCDYISDADAWIMNAWPEGLEHSCISSVEGGAREALVKTFHKQSLRLYLSLPKTSAGENWGN